MFQKNVENGKFKFNRGVKKILAQAPVRESITRGNCDFCHGKAVQGKSVYPDVFLVCEKHNKR